MWAFNGSQKKAHVSLRKGTHRDVTALVIRVNGDVQSHQLDKLLIVTVSEQGREVGRVILVLVNGRELAISKDISEDPSGDTREFGNEVHGVFKGRFPVLSLVDTVRVGFGKGRVVVELDDHYISKGYFF